MCKSMYVPLGPNVPGSSLSKMSLIDLALVTNMEEIELDKLFSLRLLRDASKSAPLVSAESPFCIPTITSVKQLEI